MKYNIRGEKVTVTQSMKSYITEKLSKMDKYFENPDEITANVLIKTQGINQRIDVTIPIKRVILRSEEVDKDLYTAIDKESTKKIENLENQIKSLENTLDTLSKKKNKLKQTAL